MKKTILILLAFNLVFATALANKDDGETRTATFTYQVSPNDAIDLKAKYTDVLIEAWDKSEVYIEATIRFDGKMNDRVQRFLDSFEEEVESNISESPGVLYIKTKLDEPNKFQLGSKGIGIQIDYGDDELRLEYKLKVPATNKLKIENSYRDVVLDGDFGEVEIDQYSGDLEVGTIDEAEIKLKYGTALFEEIKVGEMELYEQDLTVNAIGQLDIETKYSELKIKNLGNTEIVSYESDFEITNLTSLNGNLKYGKLEVTERFEEGELVTYEFDIEAKSIGSLTFKESKYGKVEADLIETLTLVESYEDDFELESIGTLNVEESKYVNYDIGNLTGKLEIEQGYEGSVDIDALGDNARSIEITGKYIETSIDTGGIAYKLLSDTKYGSVNIDKDSMNVTRYIKDGDQLEIEATSNTKDSDNPLLISIKGYEMDLKLD